MGHRKKKQQFEVQQMTDDRLKWFPPLLIRSYVGELIFSFILFFLRSVMIPTKYFVVIKMKVLAYSESLSADLTRKAFDVVGVLPCSHNKLKRGYLFVTRRANTRNSKQSTNREKKIDYN